MSDLNWVQLVYILVCIACLIGLAVYAQRRNRAATDRALDSVNVANYPIGPEPPAPVAPSEQQVPFQLGCDAFMRERHSTRHGLMAALPFFRQVEEAAIIELIRQQQREIVDAADGLAPSPAQMIALNELETIIELIEEGRHYRAHPDSFATPRAQT